MLYCFAAILLVITLEIWIVEYLGRPTFEWGGPIFEREGFQKCAHPCFEQPLMFIAHGLLSRDYGILRCLHLLSDCLDVRQGSYLLTGFSWLSVLSNICHPGMVLSLLDHLLLASGLSGPPSNSSSAIHSSSSIPVVLTPDPNSLCWTSFSSFRCFLL